MSLDADTLKRDLAAMVDDLPVTFTFSGTNYTGTRTAIGDAEELEQGGYDSARAFDLHVPVYRQSGTNWLPIFSTAPVLGNDVTVDSQAHKVTRIVTSPDGVEIVLTVIVQ